MKITFRYKGSVRTGEVFCSGGKPVLYDALTTKPCYMVRWRRVWYTIPQKDCALGVVSV